MNTTNISGLSLSCIDTKSQTELMPSSSFMSEAFSQTEYPVSHLSSYYRSKSKRSYRRCLR